MNKQFKQVGDFSAKFGFPNRDFPSVLQPNEVQDKLNLLREECDEYALALRTSNLSDCLDALCDLQYVLLGVIQAQGFESIFEQAFDRVHQANMDKVRGKKVQRPLQEVDVVKPMGWQSPTFEDLL